MPNILIIEDEKTLAKMYEEVFEKEGHDVSLASTVDEALEKAHSKKPDLILLDILLPGETGISFLNKLRRSDDDVVADIPVVAFSNYDDQESKEEAFRLGAKNYFIKTEHTPGEIVEKSIEYLN